MKFAIISGDHFYSFDTLGTYSGPCLNIQDEFFVKIVNSKKFVMVPAGIYLLKVKIRNTRTRVKYVQI